MKRAKKMFVLFVVILALVLTACSSADPKASEVDLEATVQAVLAEQAAQPAASQPAVEQPAQAQPAEVTAEAPAEDEAPAPNLLRPGEPPEEPERTLEDSKCNTTAAEKKATQGDNFLNGLYERPFAAEEMIYQPDLDILTVDFAPGEGFFFFTIRLYGMNNQGGGLQGVYGIEFDRTLSGRGDMLVVVKNPDREWSIEGLTVYGDDNRDVGGPQPVIADAGFNGSGYDSILELLDDKVAWARMDPKDGNAVQFAVSFALLGNPDGFAWGAWADNGLMDPAQYDYNDRMGPTAAGSPILGEYYPLKALYNLDNTCRLMVGTGEAYSIPGLCKVGAPPPKKGDGCTWHCTNPAAPTEERCKALQAQWVCD